MSGVKYTGAGISPAPVSLFKFTLSTQDGAVLVYRGVRRPQAQGNIIFWRAICAGVVARFEHLTGLAVERVRFAPVFTEPDVETIGRAA